jgi:hypothetical protein
MKNNIKNVKIVTLEDMSIEEMLRRIERYEINVPWKDTYYEIKYREFCDKQIKELKEEINKRNGI